MTTIQLLELALVETAVAEGVSGVPMLLLVGGVLLEEKEMEGNREEEGNNEIERKRREREKRDEKGAIGTPVCIHTVEIAGTCKHFEDNTINCMHVRCGI